MDNRNLANSPPQTINLKIKNHNDNYIPCHHHVNIILLIVFGKVGSSYLTAYKNEYIQNKY